MPILKIAGHVELNNNPTVAPVRIFDAETGDLMRALHTDL